MPPAPHDHQPPPDPLRFLEDWYAQQCDADWEHVFGVEIGTLDNPGWRVQINLDGTSWEGRAVERQIVERTEHDWHHVWSDGHRWEAACGPQNLGEVIQIFRAFLGAPVDDHRYAPEPDRVDRGGLVVPRIRYEPPGVFE